MTETFSREYPFDWCNQCTNSDLSASTLEWGENRTTLYQCSNQEFCEWLVRKARGKE